MLDTFARYLKTPITDCHVHLGGLDGIGEMIHLLDDCGIERMNIVCTSASRGRGVNNNGLALLCKALHPGRVYVSGGLHYDVDGKRDRKDFLRQAQELVAAGCDGFKMIEGKPTSRRRLGLALDDPIFDDYFAYIQEQKLPVLYHVGDPATWWDREKAPAPVLERGGGYWEGDWPSLEQLYKESEGILVKFPRLRIVFAHFYFMSDKLDRAKAFMDRWPQISFDITPGSEMYRNFSTDVPGWREFFTRYQDRICFGTDNITPREPREERYRSMLDKVDMQRHFLETGESFIGFGTGTVRGLGLGRPILEKIYRQNYQRYAGQPKKVNLPQAIAQCSRLLEDLKKAEDQPSPGETQDILRQLQALESQG